MNETLQDNLDNHKLANIINPYQTTNPETSTRSAVQRSADKCKAGSQAAKSIPVS